MSLQVGVARVIQHDETCAVTLSTDLVRFLKLAKITGMAPFKVQTITPGQHYIKTSSRLTLYSWIFILGAVIAYTATLYLEIHMKKVRTANVLLVKLLEYAVTNCCTLSCLLTLRDGTPQFMEFITYITKVDECFGDRRFERSERRTLVGLILVISTSIMIVIQEIMDDVREHQDMKVASILLDIPYLGCYVLAVVLQCKVVFLSSMLRSRAEAVRKEIRRISYMGEARSETYLRVERLHRQQVLLRRAARALDRAWGLFSTAALIFYIVEITVSIYYTMTDLAFHHTASMIVNVQWVVMNTASLILLVEPSHKYSAEDLAISRQLEIMVLHLELAHSGDCYWSRERRVTVFWLHRPAFRAAAAAVTAMGICLLRRKLLLSIMSTVTTYLVILLQVKDSDISS